MRAICMRTQSRSACIQHAAACLSDKLMLHQHRTFVAVHVVFLCLQEPPANMEQCARRQWDDPDYGGTRIVYDKAEFVKKVGCNRCGYYECCHLKHAQWVLALLHIMLVQCGDYMDGTLLKNLHNTDDVAGGLLNQTIGSARLSHISVLWKHCMICMQIHELFHASGDKLVDGYAPFCKVSVSGAQRCTSAVQSGTAAAEAAADVAVDRLTLVPTHPCTFRVHASITSPCILHSVCTHASTHQSIRRSLTSSTTITLIQRDLPCLRLAAAHLCAQLRSRH